MKCNRLLGVLCSALLVSLSRAALAEVPVDNFDDVSDWTGLKAESATLHEGSGAGRWDNHTEQKSIQKKFASPLDVSKERHLQFWAWSGVANDAQIELILDSDNESDTAGWDYYSKRIVVDWTGWKLIVLRLEDFTVSRNPLGWNHINYISMSADGWGHTPLPDTALVLDDMSFGVGVVSGVRIEQDWQASDFAYRYTVGLEDRLGQPRNLALAVEAPAGFPFLTNVGTPAVSLAANGTGESVISVTVPASQITPANRLKLDRATLVVTEQGSTRDAVVLSAAVPLDKRGHPRTLLTQADFDRIATLAASQTWATAARDSLLNAAKNWPAPFLQKYGVSQWALPPEGGQWTLWYVCPTHGVKLQYTPPLGHTCPVDQEQLTGWPYDQVVYSWMHSDLADAARDQGLAYRLGGDPAAAAQAAQILLAYADVYSTLPLHDIHGKANESGARVLAQTLDESGWLVSIAWAYDLIADSAALTDTQRSHIEQDLLRAASRVIARHPAGMSNWQSWHNAGIGAAAFALEDPVGIAQVMLSPTDGFAYQMENSVSADGFWYEGSWGYHFYALDALMKLAEMATRAGLQPYSDPSLRGMFEAPLRFAMPDGTLPAFNDSGSASLWSNARYYETAYQRYQDPTLTSFLGKATRGRDALFWGAETLPSTKPPELSSLLFPEAGYAVLRAGSGKEASYAALDFGPHGGGHGHYDKLGFVLYSRGGLLGIDPGTQSYAAPTHTTWDKVTLAHNTVVVDEKSQAEATGKLHRFTALPGLSFSAAEAGNASSGASLLRTLLMTPEYVVDRFRAASSDSAAHKYDWIFHAPGERTTTAQLSAYSAFPNSEGYQHLKNEQSAQLAQDWQVQFAQKPQAGPYGSSWADQSTILSSFTYSKDQAASGSWSGKLEYDFSQTNGYVLYSTPTLEEVKEIPSALRLQVYGDGSGNKLSFRLYDSTDERFVTEAGVLDWTGWKSFDVAGMDGWQHYLGNADGVFDLPPKRAAIGITFVPGAKAKSAVYADDIKIAYPVAGDVLVTDFELAARGVRVWMAGEADTTLVVGDGLGPDLMVPVPFALARRQGQGSTFLSLLEPFGEAPSVTAFAALQTNAQATDEATAVEVTAAQYQDRVLALADGKGGASITFGPAACDGVLCQVRRQEGTLRRVVLAEGSQVSENSQPLVRAQSALPALQGDWDSAGARLDLVVSVALETELRLLGPTVNKVTVGGVDTPFVRDGDYVVLNLHPTPDAGLEGGVTEGGLGNDGSLEGGAGEGGIPAGANADSDSGGCGCRLADSEATSVGGLWWLLGFAAWLRGRRSKQDRSLRP